MGKAPQQGQENGSVKGLFKGGYDRHYREGSYQGGFPRQGKCQFPKRRKKLHFTQSFVACFCTFRVWSGQIFLSFYV
jgi:hypothetical protein